MYVVDGTEISGTVKALLETNPFQAKITELEEKVRTQERKVNDYASNIRSYEEDLKNNRISLNVETQKQKKYVAEMKLMKKAAEESAQEHNCDFLNAGVMEKFFHACGMRFIGLSIKQNGNSAQLSFVRPAKLINALPVPPMVVVLNYKLKSGVLAFDEGKISCPVNVGNYIHPHISGSSICMGNFWEVLNANNGSLLMEGYQDQVLLLDQMFQTYNADSPFRGIDEIMTDMISKITIHTDMTTEIDNYSTFTFKNSKLNTAQTEYPTFELISREWFEQWYEMLANCKPATLVDDIMARLVMLASNYGSSDYSRLDDWRGDLLNAFPNLSFTDPDDYCHNDDGDDDALYEDDFDTIKSEWLATLTAYLATDECKEGKSLFVNLPDLDKVFLPPAVVVPPPVQAPPIEPVTYARAMMPPTSDSSPF